MFGFFPFALMFLLFFGLFGGGGFFKFLWLFLLIGLFSRLVGYGGRHRYGGPCGRGWQYDKSGSDREDDPYEKQPEDVEPQIMTN